MAIIRWNPFRPFEELDKFFERGFLPLKEEGFFDPACDVYETDKDMVVEANLPGVKPEKIDVNCEDNVLTIKGSSEKKIEVKKRNYYRKEISSGSFSRSITLPVEVICNKAKAEYADGVLKVTIPKTTPKKPSKKIEIKVRGKE